MSLFFFKTWEGTLSSTTSTHNGVPLHRLLNSRRLPPNRESTTNSPLQTPIQKLTKKQYITSRLFTALYNITIHPLCIYPGPKFRSAFHFPTHYEACNGNSAANIKALHDKYGPVVRISPNQLSYASSQAWRGRLLVLILKLECGGEADGSRYSYRW